MDSIRRVRLRILNGCIRDSYLAIVRTRILVLPTTGAYRYVSHGPTGSPVSLAVLAEMTRLVDIVIIVVTELGVHAITSGARK
jgi:hypothetical protein